MDNALHSLFTSLGCLLALALNSNRFSLSNLDRNLTFHDKLFVHGNECFLLIGLASKVDKTITATISVGLADNMGRGWVKFCEKGFELIVGELEGQVGNEKSPVRRILGALEL